jgi:serine/threonine protein kinase
MATLTRLEAGQVFAGDFRVVRLLAEGGMGAVYEAMQTSSGHRRALKVLHPHIVEDARNRASFEQEARLGAQIQSDHVVQVIAAGVDEPTRTPWLAMEFLEGQSLADRVKQGGPLPSAEARLVVEQLGEALGAAHASGIVHRDLKPENLFIARSRMKGMPFVVKVLDFGISKLIAENKTSATATRAIGSPLWAAPEQTRTGAKLRPATDVWALGLIVFYVLTGEYYWLAPHAEGFNLPALLTEIILEPMEPASVRAARYGAAERVPPGFDAWFARCVVRDADQRYVDAAQAVGALLALWQGSSAAPPMQPPAPIAHTMTAPVPFTPTQPIASSAPFTPAMQPSGVSGSVPFAVASPAVQTVSRRGPPFALLGAVVAGGIVFGGVGFLALRPSAQTAPQPAPTTAIVAQTQATNTPPTEPAAPPPATTEPPPPAAPQEPAPTQSAEQPVVPGTHDRREPSTPAPTPPVRNPQEPMVQARACFGSSNANECIINALRGRASSERELALLATTYQAAGRRTEAVRTKRTYLQRYPTGPLAARFQNDLAREEAP